MKKKKSKQSVVTLLVLSALTGCQNLSPLAKKIQPPDALMVQEVTAAEPIPQEPAPIVQSEKELYPVSGSLVGRPAGEATHEKEGKYELNFEEADLSEVIKTILGDTLNLNYTISPKVMGKVNMKTTRRLAEDEMIPTLEMILKMNGAVLIKKGSLYKIEPETGALMGAPGAKLGLLGKTLNAGYQLRVVPLRYVGVAEMQKVVEPLMPPKSVVRADEVRNLLLLAGSAEELESVIQTIQIFDVDFMRGMSVGLYPLKNVDPQTIASELEKLLGENKGPLGGMFKIMPIDRLNAILAVTPQPRYLDEVENWIERLDRYTAKRSGNMHVYRVQNVDAIELANTISQIFSQASGGRTTPGMSLAPGMGGSSIGGGSSAYDSTSGMGGFGDSSSNLSGGSSSSGFSSGASGSTGMGSSTGMGTGTSMGSSTGTSLGGQTGSTNSASPGLSGSLGSSSSNRSRRSTSADLGNQMRIVADPANNALIIMAKAQDYKEIETVIKELDVLPLQVLIDANIVEVTLDGSLSYGLQWLFTHGQNAGARADSTTKINEVVNAATTAGSSAAGGFAYAFAGKDIKLVINALANDNKINVISSPSLMVLNNQQANINVGDRVPVSTGGGIVTTASQVQAPGIQYQESGVTLKVRPRVNSGGLVIMDIIQELSTPSDATVGGILTSKFAQRKIQSQVAVNNGDTLALGGLISDSTSVSDNGLPYLNKIPYLGWLFGATSKSTKRTELVVLLTPRVVEKRRDVTAISNEFRRRLTGIKTEHSLDNLQP